jgi:hypothetical protein
MDKKARVAIISILVIVTLLLVSLAVAKQGNGKTKTQCNDHLDNDADGFCDYSGCQIGKGRNKQFLPADVDCASADDNSESPECVPSAEVCDGLDNNCNGEVDESLTQQCGISNVGECSYGTQTCSAGNWGSCQGNVDPVAGWVPEVKGTTTQVYNGQEYVNTDSCVSETILTEWYCSGNTSFNNNVTCSGNGTTCVDGACV